MSFLAIVIYFAPSILGWIVKRSAPGLQLGRLVAANLLLGWTGIGWLGCVGYVVYALVKRGSGALPPGFSPAVSGAPPLAPSPSPSGDQPRERRKCSSCTAGQARCGLCGGQRGSHRDNVWVPCTYCLGSGTVQCTSCGGSGYAN